MDTNRFEEIGHSNVSRSLSIVVLLAYLIFITRADGLTLAGKIVAAELFVLPFVWRPDRFFGSRSV